MPSLEALLEVIAEVEPLERTLEAFPELSREELVGILLGAPTPPVKAKPSATVSKQKAAGKQLFIWTDGASRGNPGAASVGAVIQDENGKVLDRISRAIGRRTNNYAEYE